MALFEPLIEALNRAGVRYVVVGGLAVVLHGYARLTADLDLVVDLTTEEARKTIATLVNLGLVPVAPVDAADFADPSIRSQWATEKNMKVFSLVDPSDPLRQVDLFVENPIDFEDLWQRSVSVELGHSSTRIASIPDLIHMKRISGRPQDLADIEALETLMRDAE